MQITEARIMKRKCTFILMALSVFAVGVVGALSGCEQDTSRKNAPAVRPRSANHQQTPTGAANGASVRAFKLPMLIVHKVNEEDEGGCRFFPLTITLTKSGEPLRVSFSEDTPSGTGNVIRNSLWTAALIAALQKNSTLQGVRISLDFKGGIDGPSAGAVMCLGIMSALDQRGFPDDFAMTGALLPDGTIGLVGGVPEKLAAAAKDPKIKRVAIPAFQRFAQDKDGNWVDLFETGRKWVWSCILSNPLPTPIGFFIARKSCARRSSLPSWIAVRTRRSKAMPPASSSNACRSTRRGLTDCPPISLKR